MATKKKDVVAENEEKVVEEATDSSTAAEVFEADMSKTNMMSIAMKKMAGMPYPDMVKLFNDMIAQIGTEAEQIPDDAAAKNAASIAMKGAIKEDIEKLFGGDETLTEEFKEKVSTLFEAAVNIRVAAREAELQEEYAQKLEEQATQITESLVDKMDEYINYLAEEWMDKNEVAIENSLTNEISKEFIEGLRNLFIEHNIRVPEESVDVTEALVAKVEELEEKLNESVEINVKLAAIVEEFEKDKAIESISEGMTLNDVEKLRTLAEGIDFDGDIDAYKKKLEIIKEHHFSSKSAKKDTKLITEEIEHSPDEIEEGVTKVVAPEMSKYVTAISRTVKR